MADPWNRWPAVEYYSAEVKDLGLGRVLRNYYLIWWPLSVAVLLPLSILFTSMLVPGPRTVDSLQPAFLFAAVAVMGVSWIYLIKRVRTAVIPYDPDVLSLLDRPQRRAVRRQIFGRIQLHPEQPQVARAAAVQLRKKLAEQLIFASYLIPFIAGWQLSLEPLWFWMFTVLGAVLLAVTILDLRRFVLTGRFLERTAPGKEG
ncbi:hypothetical protein [Arthrobacter pigmenti]|nr:hypothetical protein [Arthrobacter pigmenti]